MATALSTLRTVVTDALGRADTQAQTWADRGINYGQRLVAKLYTPPELKEIGALLVPDTLSYVPLTSLTDLYFITRLYNRTSGQPVHLSEFLRWHFVIPDTTGLYVKYAARYGDQLLISPMLTQENILDVYYIKKPTGLSADDDELGFEGYDEFVTSYATSYAFACVEEKESSELFTSVMSVLNSGEAVGLQAKGMIEQALRST